MKIVKTIMRNCIEDEFINDCIICSIEPGFLAIVPINVVMVCFHKMKDHSHRETLYQFDIA